MRKYTINKEDKPKVPSKETIEKYKDFSRLSHEYDRLTKRPKLPLYKDKKMFLVLLLILLIVYLVAQSTLDESEKETPDTTIEHVDQEFNND